MATNNSQEQPTEGERLVDIRSRAEWIQTRAVSDGFSVADFRKIICGEDIPYLLSLIEQRDQQLAEARASLRKLDDAWFAYRIAAAGDDHTNTREKYDLVIEAFNELDGAN